jgi:hypothetical protein
MARVRWRELAFLYKNTHKSWIKASESLEAALLDNRVAVAFSTATITTSGYNEGVELKY